MSFFKRLFTSFSDLFTSKKFLVTVGTVAANALIKDEGLRNMVTGSGAAYVLAQGAADLGKNISTIKDLVGKVVSPDKK